MRRRAFTLVELITVIAIIAGVASILLPTISKIKREVQKIQDVSHLKKIRDAWQTYVDLNKEPLSGHDDYDFNVAVFAEQLAGRGKSGKENIILNDPSVYISPGDKYGSKAAKTAFCHCKADGSIDPLGSPWTSDSKNDLGSFHIVSYCIVGNVPVGAPRETTPIAFTRGLCADGTWHDKYSLYGDSGGYVAFADGHVRWFDGKRPARFLKWDQTGYTTDIRQAVPSSSWIMCGCNSGGVNANIKNKNNSLMITYHTGTGGAE